MRISDWSSDVCSSDLNPAPMSYSLSRQRHLLARVRFHASRDHIQSFSRSPVLTRVARGQDRKSVVEGKSVSVRVDLGGRRIIKKKIKTALTNVDHLKSIMNRILSAIILLKIFK